MATVPLRAAAPAADVVVRNAWDGTVLARISPSVEADAPALLTRAQAGLLDMRGLSRQARAGFLEGAAEAIRRSSEDFAAVIVAEAGKTIRQARKEVARCVNTLKLSAEEAKRNAGEVLPFDAYAGSEDRRGWFTREPLGIITAITPYNDPLNLVAHKLGPALAGGNAVLLKPSELAPLSALRLVDALVAAGMPARAVTIAIGGADIGRALVRARNVRMVSFTGGFATGEAIAAAAGLKKLAMDLGGNAPVIVMGDCDLDAAVAACVSGAFWAAGQNCVGTQRILIEKPVYARFRDGFVAATLALVVGDPRDERTDVGPMITEAAASRALAAVGEAVSAGARLLCGGTAQANLCQPTVLENVPHDCRLWKDEVFAPVVMLEPFDGLDDGLAAANQPEYSLHAGIFTASLDVALRAADLIDAGGVMINDSSDYRFDAMPFGGSKYGNMGREGVRFAYEDMTQPKVVCIANAVSSQNRRRKP